MKKTFLLFGLLACIFTNAQTVNHGTILLGDTVYGNRYTTLPLPSYGTSGQVLTSNGVGYEPYWTSIGSGSGWSLTGNSGISPATNFIGTTDTATLLFKEDGLIAGQLGQGNTKPINTSFGFSSLPYNSGNWNSSFGGANLQRNSTGRGNSSFGTYGLQVLTSGINNSTLGFYSMNANITGSSNTADGAYSGYNDLGSFNTFLGDSSGYNNTTGFSNVAVGYAAGAGYSGGYGYGNTALGDSAYFQTNGNQNTCIGYQASCGTHQSNSTAIGAGALCSSGNQVVLGNTAVTSFVFNGDLEAGLGNYGTSGQALISGGPGVAPQWTTISSGADSGIARGWGIKTTQTEPRVISIDTTAGNLYGARPSSQNAWYTYLKNTYTGTSHITTLGTIVTGVWNGSTISKGYLNDSVLIAGTGVTLSRGSSGITINSSGGTNYLNDTVGGSGSKPNLATATNSWSTTGNSGISGSTNFIGTINNASLNFKVFNGVAGIVSVGGSGLGVCLGYQTPTTAGEVSAFGTGALAFTSGGTYYNTAFGYGAGQTNVGGSYNTLIGAISNVGSNNLNNATALGYQAVVTSSNTIQAGNSGVTNFNLGGGAYNIPIQISSVTTGTVVANGAQVLEFTGSTPSVQVTEPANPQTGQQWEIAGTGVVILTWTNPGNFYMTPPTAINLGTAPNFYGHAFYYDGTKWVQKY